MSPGKVLVLMPTGNHAGSGEGWTTINFLIPLLGQHQMENAATAVAALEVLIEKGFHISADNIIEGLAKVNWPGRLQVLSRHPLLVVDGAHNPYSAGKLRDAIRQYFRFEQAILIIVLPQTRI